MRDSKRGNPQDENSCLDQEYPKYLYIKVRTFLNSHLFWLNSHPSLARSIICRLNLSGLWSIRAQLENLPAEVIELIKEHTLKV